MRVAIVLVGALSTSLALAPISLCSLWTLSSELVYVVLFPQLVSVIYARDRVNTYGSLAAFVVGIVLRTGGGEEVLSIPVIIKYPFYDEAEGQLFPFRTVSMLFSFIALFSVSAFAKWLFNGRVPIKLDVCRCFVASSRRLSDVRSSIGHRLKQHIETLKEEQQRGLQGQPEQLREEHPDLLLAGKVPITPSDDNYISTPNVPTAVATVEKAIMSEPASFGEYTVVVEGDVAISEAAATEPAAAFGIAAETTVDSAERLRVSVSKKDKRKKSKCVSPVNAESLGSQERRN